MLLLFVFALALTIVGSMNEGGSRSGQEGLVIVITISVFGLCSFCIECRSQVKENELEQDFLPLSGPGTC